MTVWLVVFALFGATPFSMVYDSKSKACSTARTFSHSRPLIIRVETENSNGEKVLVSYSQDYCDDIKSPGADGSGRGAARTPTKARNLMPLHIECGGAAGSCGSRFGMEAE